MKTLEGVVIFEDLAGGWFYLKTERGDKYTLLFSRKSPEPWQTLKRYSDIGQKVSITIKEEQDVQDWINSTPNIISVQSIEDVACL